MGNYSMLLHDLGNIAATHDTWVNDIDIFIYQEKIYEKKIRLKIWNS